MKTSLSIATFLMLSAGAASAGAIVSPYQGSDTEFNIITQAIAQDGTILPLTAYVGGGSGNGQTAMVGGTQVTAPMSRMMNSGSGLCTFSGGTANASAIVIGLDGVDVVGSLATGASAACNGTADNAGTGLVHSNAANGFTTWKQALALVYGGEANPSDAAHFRCDGPKRAALVASWTNLFQNACANTQSVCNDATHGGVLWHAFRRDDASGTSDVFASVLGLSPSTSASSNSGFGASPYCNALNWETGNGNGTTCALATSDPNGMHKQFVGPGGVPDPVANDGGLHRRPPPGTWGDVVNTSNKIASADVLPTSMQDNDPIRRTCIGTTQGGTHSAEDVCNIDGSSLSAPGHLGLVLAIPATDYIPKENPGLSQYPTTVCKGAQVGVKAPSILTCAPQRTATHSGACPNGDAGVCYATLASGNATSQCLASKSTVENLGTNQGDGRAFNIWMFDGTTSDGLVGYVKQQIPTATGTLALDSATGMGRLHSLSTVPGGLHTCQLSDATDQIGCLVQADPCSIGYAGDGAKSWDQRAGIAGGPFTDAIRVHEIAPTTATIQALGTAGEYELARKLYFSSLPGFAAANVAATKDEIRLAKDVSTASFIDPILLSTGFFTLGASSPMGNNNQFCEDFNQAAVCPTQNATNDNACNRNPATLVNSAFAGGIPGDPSAVASASTTSTVCGNGKVEAYEECDNGTANGTSGNSCSVTCRCGGAFQYDCVGSVCSCQSN